MIISIFAFLVVFTIVVLVHELGHFIAARKAGIKVYEFSIGFPFSPKIFTLFRHKETEFTVRKPLSLKTYQVVNLLGMSLFIILTVLVTYRDIVKLIA